MKYVYKYMICFLLMAFILIGCSSNTTQLSNSKDTQSEITANSENDVGQNTQMINSNELEKKKEDGKSALVVAGDNKTEEYTNFFEVVEELAKERSMEVYVLDITAEENKNWKVEEEADDNMNIVVMNNGYKVVCPLDEEELYQKNILGGLVDTILGQLKGM